MNIYKRIILYIGIGLISFFALRNVLPKYTTQGRQLAITKEFINQNGDNIKEEFPCLYQLSFYTGGGMNVVICDGNQSGKIGDYIKSLGYDLPLVISVVKKSAQQGDAPEPASPAR